MKKALSVLLSMLMIFSMVGVMAFAEGEIESEATVHVVFYDEDEQTILHDLMVKPGQHLGPLVVNPEKAETETTRYIFKGWKGEDGEVYYDSTLPDPTGEDTEIIYVAEYSTEDLTQRQTFWNLIESIFERLNLIFQYFAEIFGF